MMALKQLEPEYQQMRDIWDDQSQKFEHELMVAGNTVDPLHRIPLHLPEHER